MFPKLKAFPRRLNRGENSILRFSSEFPIGLNRGRMISQLSSFRNNHAFATPLFFNVRLPAFATFLLSQPHAFATIFLLSQPFCLFGNVKKSSFRNKVLVSQQKSPRFATSFLVSHPSPRFATTKSSFRNNFPRFATSSLTLARGKL